MPLFVVEAKDDKEPSSTMLTEIGRWVPQAWVTAPPTLESSVYGFDPHTDPSVVVQVMVMVDPV